MFILWRQGLMVPRWADKRAASSTFGYYPGSQHMGQNSKQREGGKDTQLVAGQWRSNGGAINLVTSERRCSPTPGAGCPRMWGGKIPGCPRSTQASEGSRRWLQTALWKILNYFSPTDHRLLRQGRAPLIIFYFTLLASIIK